MTFARNHWTTRQLIRLSYSFSMSSAGKIGNTKNSPFCLLVVFRGTKIRFLFLPHNTMPWKVTAFSPFLLLIQQSLTRAHAHLAITSKIIVTTSRVGSIPLFIGAGGVTKSVTKSEKCDEVFVTERSPLPRAPSLTLPKGGGKLGGGDVDRKGSVRLPGGLLHCSPVRRTGY